MKLMAIIGSPRKGGNTELLINQVIAGCSSKTAVDLEKLFVVGKKIEYCTGCMSCVMPSPGTGKCVITDDMNDILEQMKQSDAFIFGTPNHMRTITAPLLNFITRMLPLLEFRAEYDSMGNRIGGEMTSKLGGKKAAVVITQGEPYFCSSLVYDTLISNLHDFRLHLAGNIVSLGNLEKGRVADRKQDLKNAFDLGVQLAVMGAAQNKNEADKQR
jgi:multimeric flavodoxin WrbA